MRPLRTLTLFAALLPGIAWYSPAPAQPAQSNAGSSLGRAERIAVDLKQGMTLEEVEKLLGKPRRTALKNAGNNGSQGNLQWTYSWGNASSSNRFLQVVFAAKAPEQWTVTGWDWIDY